MSIPLIGVLLGVTAAMIGKHMIKKQDSKYVVKSKSGKKTLGTYSTKKEAEKRLRQIEYFKHKKGAKKK